MSPGETIILAAIIAAISAIMGVGIGSFVSYRIAKQQFKATVLSGNRQQWINTLRDCLAEFQSNVSLLGLEEHDSGKLMRRASLQRFKITLFINPKEDDHKELLSLVGRLMRISFTGAQEEGVKPAQLQYALSSVAQSILKREWERVKRGD